MKIITIRCWFHREEAADTWCIGKLASYSDMHVNSCTVFGRINVLKQYKEYGSSIVLTLSSDTDIDYLIKSLYAESGVIEILLGGSFYLLTSTKHQ